MKIFWKEKCRNCCFKSSLCWFELVFVFFLFKFLIEFFCADTRGVHRTPAGGHGAHADGRLRAAAGGCGAQSAATPERPLGSVPARVHQNIAGASKNVFFILIFKQCSNCNFTVFIQLVDQLSLDSVAEVRSAVYEGKQEKKSLRHNSIHNFIHC